MSIEAEPSAYALLTDGTTIEIRAARPDDFDAVRDMHAKMSPGQPLPALFQHEPAGCRARGAPDMPRARPGPCRAADDAGRRTGRLRHLRAGRGAESLSAEVAFTVADDMQNRGVGMLLLEHLVSLGRGRGFRAFTAETLSENAARCGCSPTPTGLQAQRSLADGVYDLRFPLPINEADAALGTYRDTVAVRERSADVASMRHGLIPASVAVIGASRRRGAVGRVILRNIITGGFSGAGLPGATQGRLSWTACPACRRRPRCPKTSTWRLLPFRRRPCLVSPKNAGSGGSRSWSWSRQDSAARPARNCWASAAATACG